LIASVKPIFSFSGWRPHFQSPSVPLYERGKKRGILEKGENEKGIYKKGELKGDLGGLGGGFKSPRGILKRGGC